MKCENDCDLHVHTTYSDASRNVREVMEYAKMIGLKYIAITDHDTMAGVEEAEYLGEALGVKVIPGVEISSRDEETGRSVHVLCYNPQDCKLLESFLKKTRERRQEQKLKMVDKIREIYPLLNREVVKKYAENSKSIYECHIMQPLCDMGYTNTAVGELMVSLISSKGSCFVPSRYPKTKEVINLIRHVGGVAVIAHAQQFNSFELIERYARENLIRGVEVWHPRNDEESRQRLLMIAKRYKLLLTGGSDYHGQYARNPKPLGFCGCSINDAERIIKQ